MTKDAILVPDVHTRAQLAALRSLGRAGYQTVAVSQKPDAMGLYSNFSQNSLVHPPYEGPEYLGWLREVVRQFSIRMIVPSGTFLSAIRENFAEFTALLPLSDDVATVYRAGNKIAAFEVYRDRGLLAHHPMTLVAKAGALPTIEDLSHLPTPIYLKGGLGGDGEIEGEGFLVCADARRASSALEDMIAGGYTDVLVQGAVRGRQAGVSLLMAEGNALAANCVIDCHAEPHSKGTMSLRRTFWNEALLEDAVARLRALNWTGCAMVEYRVEEDLSDFNVIEVNARFWQYLHLDIHSGVDFPRLTAEWFLEGKIPSKPKPIIGMVCRDSFPGEVAQLVNAFRSPKTSFWQRATDVGRFLFRFFNLGIRQDLMFQGDHGLYWRELKAFLLSEIRNVMRKR